jgi:hypothetical protein
MVKVDTAPDPLPASRFKSGRGLLTSLRDSPDCLFYFLFNIGDGDTQLILLPAETDAGGETPSRRALVVDVGTTEKLPGFVESLAGEEILIQRKDLFPIVIGSHPHDDHIGGMPEFIDRLGDYISEYWEPGYYHPTPAYIETMRALEMRPHIVQTQPTSGMSRFVGKVKLTTLSPGIGLRNRFDSYGTTINDASIALKIEFPASRVVQQGVNRAYLRLNDPWAIVLGADAQTTSWAQATVDFPQLHSGPRSAVYQELRKAMGADWLKAQIFKVPHHASKHGVNIELVERMGPKLALISSTGGAGRYGFPHHLAVEAIREGMEPTTSGNKRSDDHAIGIHYTSAIDARKAKLGSIALMVPPKRGSALRMWRLGDAPGERIDLSNAREYVLR